MALSTASAEAPQQLSYMHPPIVDAAHEDRTTGLMFDKKISVETSGKLNNVHMIVGSGAKYRYGFLKQYAVALYLPPGYAAASRDDNLVLVPIINGDVSASVVIRMNRDTDVKAFVFHIEEALRYFTTLHAADREVCVCCVCDRELKLTFSRQHSAQATPSTSSET